MHVDDASSLPDDLVFVRYEAPDDLQHKEVHLDRLPKRWTMLGDLTRHLGNEWLDGASACLLRVPSVIVPIPDTRDRNVVINHRQEDARRITLSRIDTFPTTPDSSSSGKDLPGYPEAVRSLRAHTNFERILNILADTRAIGHRRDELDP